MAKKSQKTKKSLKELFAYGGVSMNIDSPSEDLAQMKKVTEDATYGAKFNPASMGLKALGGMLTSTGLSMAGKGFAGANDLDGMSGFLQDNFGVINSLVGGASATTMMATGGTTRNSINAEGKEIVESPGGEPLELSGPSHAGGGIDLEVPDGTVVYSKRLKGSDGKTMAERKKAREKEEDKLKKLFDANPTDKMLKNTYQRVKENNKLVDTTDVAKMDFVRNLLGGTETFLMGGTSGPGPTYNKPVWLKNLQGLFPQGDIESVDMTSYEPLQNNSVGVILPGSTAITDPGINSVIPKTNNTPVTGSKKANPLANIFGGDGLTLGDTIGLAGTLTSTFGPLQTTLANRAGDTPNINAFENYGQEGLSKLDESKEYVNQVRDQQLQDLELSRQGAFNRNSNSARGLNTIRALNLATDSAANNTKSGIHNQFAQMMTDILGKEAAFMNDRDSKVMQGDYARDQGDRMDRDNFFSQLSQNIASMGTGLQSTGKNVNDIKTRNVTTKLLNQMYNNFEINSMTGEVKAKATEEVKTNPSFYSNPSLNKTVANNIFQGVYTRKGNQVFDKNGNEVNITTGEVVNNPNNSNNYKLDVYENYIYDMFSPFNTQQE